MRLLRYAALAALAPLLWLLYALSGLLPRSEDLWAFGAWDGRRFADNTKWFFLHCLRMGYPGRFVWITRDRPLARRLAGRGYEAHYHRSVRGLWYALRAKYYVIDHSSQDINYFASRGSVKVCLFHGIPLKRLRRDVSTPGNFNHAAYHGPQMTRLLLLLTRPALYESYDLVCATSPNVAATYASAFATPLRRIAITGYPRNDLLVDPGQALDEHDRGRRDRLDEIRQEGRKVVMYLPTWRDHARGGSAGLDRGELATFMAAHAAVLVTKHHSYDDSGLTSEPSSEHHVVLDHEVDVYPLLTSVDVLVTDYSSVAFDYLFLDRPIVYYCYDLADYLRHARTFYYDYGTVTPGAKANDYRDLVNALEQALTDPSGYQERWRSVRTHTMGLCHSHEDSGASVRVYEEIRRRFGGGSQP